MKHEHLDETRPAREPARRAIDDALGQALRAEDPGAAFTQRVLARAREERAAQQSGRPLPRIGVSRRVSVEDRATSSEVSRADVSGSIGAAATRCRRGRARLTTTRKLIAAIAASLTLAAAGAQWMQHRRYVAEGERARAQVLAALRLTNEKLNIVHDKITEREHAR